MASILRADIEFIERYPISALLALFLSWVMIDIRSVEAGTTGNRAIASGGRHAGRTLLASVVVVSVVAVAVAAPRR
ncbi:hypothetical protein F4861DRAFT_539867 [Xylaria intraflava]|nr:hypothetical protein F4861DRAFT_539867 [Xylaria intraflava]